MQIFQLRPDTCYCFPECTKIGSKDPACAGTKSPTDQTPTEFCADYTQGNKKYPSTGYCCPEDYNSPEVDCYKKSDQTQTQRNTGVCSQPGQKDDKDCPDPSQTCVDYTKPDQATGKPPNDPKTGQPYKHKGYCCECSGQERGSTWQESHTGIHFQVPQASSSECSCFPERLFRSFDHPIPHHTGSACFPFFALSLLLLPPNECTGKFSLFWVQAAPLCTLPLSFSSQTGP